MASKNRRTIFNTRERLLSTDLNAATDLIHASATDELISTITGNAFRGATPRSGVTSGGIVTANGVDLTVSVSPLLGFKLGSAPTAYDSTYLKVETTVAVSIDLTPYVDPANPRWVAIEVAPDESAETISSRDVFVPALGSFTPTNVTKVMKPDPVFTVNAGTAAAAPALPTGTAGVLPLAYVYLAAAASQAEVLDVILCRPILFAALQPESWLRGRGGIDVVTQVGPSYLAKPRELAYRPAGRPVQAIANGAELDLGASGDPNWANGEALPSGADDAVFVYFAEAPYPSGYDADAAAAREFVDASGRLPSNPAAQGWPYSANGIFVYSIVAPSSTSARGAPSSAITAVNDPAWNSGTFSNLVYVGSVVFDDSETNLKPQRVQRQDNGWVFFAEGSGVGSVGGTVTDSATGAVNVVAANGRRVSVLDNSTPVVLPPYVRDIKLRVVHNVSGGAGLGDYTLSETGSGDADFGVFFQSRFDTTIAAVNGNDVIDVYLDDSGGFTVTNTGAGGVTSAIIPTTRAYLDSILAMR